MLYIIIKLYIDFERVFMDNGFVLLGTSYVLVSLVGN